MLTFGGNIIGLVKEFMIVEHTMSYYAVTGIWNIIWFVIFVGNIIVFIRSVGREYTYVGVR